MLSSKPKLLTRIARIRRKTRKIRSIRGIRVEVCRLCSTQITHEPTIQYLGNGRLLDWWLVIGKVAFCFPKS